MQTNETMDDPLIKKTEEDETACEQAYTESKPESSIYLSK